MWLFLWVVFVLAAGGFFLWSYHAIYEQKRSWKAFALKHNLRFEGGRLMDSPAMTGQIKGRDVNFYPQMVETLQGQKVAQNVIEVFLNEIPSIFCVVAKQGLIDFITSLELPEPFQVDDKEWPKNLLSRTLEDRAPELWFMQNSNRVKAISNLNKTPFDFAFLADTEQAFIAIRTSKPLTNPKQLNKVMSILFDAANKLEKEIQITEDQAPSIIAKPNDDRDTDVPPTDESKL